MLSTHGRWLSAGAGLVVALAAACAPAMHNGGSAAEQEVRAAMTGFLDALNALDTPRMVGWFTDDVTAFVPSVQAERADGKAAVSRIFEAFATRSKSATSRSVIRPSDMIVEASGALGVVSFVVRDSAASKLNRRTFVFRRTGSSWRIAHFHASDMVLPAVQAPR